MQKLLLLVLLLCLFESCFYCCCCGFGCGCWFLYYRRSSVSNFYDFIRIHNVWYFVSDKRWWWILYFVDSEQHHHNRHRNVYLIHVFFCWGESPKKFVFDIYFWCLHLIIFQYCLLYFLLSPLASVGNGHSYTMCYDRFVQRNHKKKMIWYQNQYCRAARM